MCVAWRRRLAVPVFAVLVFIVCDAQVEQETQLTKYIYPRQNHWAVGHLMGKKSIDEMQSSEEGDGVSELYLTVAESEEHSQPSGFLQALITALAGPKSERERDRERARDTSLRQQRALEQRKLLEEQLQREREQTAKILLLALNMRDPSKS
ncbi:gastrin-releasing peptide [Hoplias malabaricus]|uniref:gastrin-releasing peptide n=1 Tax=Hoplias malabaricus TaxID=27720 RepID=UPI0034623679